MDIVERQVYDAGIPKIKDILDEHNMFLTYSKFCLKTVLKESFTKMFDSCYTKYLETLRPACNIPGLNVEPNAPVQASELTCIFIQTKFEEPAASSRICRQGADVTMLFHLK